MLHNLIKLKKLRSIDQIFMHFILNKIQYISLQKVIF